MLYDFIAANPELTKNVRALLRPAQLIATLVVGLLVGICVLLLASGPVYNGMTEQGVQDWSRNCFWAAICLQILIVSFYAANQTAASVASEREHGTLEMLVLTPMPKLTIAIGKLLGHPIKAWVLWASLLPFEFFAFLVGGIEGPVGLQAMLLVAAAAFFCNALALLASASMEKSRQASGMTTGILVLLGFVAYGFIDGGAAWLLVSGLSPIPALVSMIYAKEVTMVPVRTQVPFLGVDVPVAWLTIGYYLFFGVWLLVAAVRKLRDPALAFLSKLQGLAVLVCLEALLVCTLVGRATSVGTWSGGKDICDEIGAFLIVSILVLSFGAVALANGRPKAIEWIRRNSRDFVPGLRPYFAENAPGYGAGILAAAVFAGALAVLVYGVGRWAYALPLVLRAFVVLAHFFVAMLLTELLELRLKKNGRRIAALILVLANVALAVLGGIAADSDGAWSICPIAYLAPASISSDGTILTVTSGPFQPSYWTCPGIMLAALAGTIALTVSGRKWARYLLQRRADLPAPANAAAGSPEPAE